MREGNTRSAQEIDEAPEHNRVEAVMRGSEFTELRAFALVAETGSFVRASERLGITPSAMSHTLRTLEERLGVQLLHRTTRSVSLTDAGKLLLTRVQPALAELDAATSEIDAKRRKPSGTVRIVTPRIAFVDHLQPVIPDFHQSYPDVVLDLTINDGVVDIVSGGYDLGIRLGEYLEQEVVAFPLGSHIRQIAVASPAYLRSKAVPVRRPSDLHQHACISWRQTGTTMPYEWEFAKGRQQVRIAVTGPLILNDRELALAAALDGLGITLWAEHRVRPYIASGKLVALLEDWSPSFPSFFAYYRKRPLMPSATRVLIETLMRLHTAKAS